MIRSPRPVTPGDLDNIGGVSSKTLDQPVVAHCHLCHQMRFLRSLEIYAPEPRSVQYRCIRGAGCRLAEGQPTVSFQEGEDGRVTLLEDESALVDPVPVGAWGHELLNRLRRGYSR